MTGQGPVSTGTTARPAGPVSRRHEQSWPAPEPPDDEEKYSYVRRNLTYLTTIIVIGSSCVIFSQLRFETQDLALLPFLVFTVVFAIYQAISLPVNFAGAGFDLDAHRARIQAWRPPSFPDVDIYLPICGEPAELLRNTWTAVLGLIEDYGGHAQAYVLDDGPAGDARPMAESYGFGYFRRPDWPDGQESRQPPVRLFPDQRRVPAHPGRGLRAPARLPGRDTALPGRSEDRDRADPAVLQDQS